jgi:hypothetical protein
MPFPRTYLLVCVMSGDCYGGQMGIVIGKQPLYTFYIISFISEAAATPSGLLLLISSYKQY